MLKHNIRNCRPAGIVNTTKQQEIGMCYCYFCSFLLTIVVVSGNYFKMGVWKAKETYCRQLLLLGRQVRNSAADFKEVCRVIQNGCHKHFEGQETCFRIKILPSILLGWIDKVKLTKVNVNEKIIKKCIIKKMK